MTNRKNEVVCTFDLTAPRLSAYEVHIWIRDELRLPLQDVYLVQLDGHKRSVYIKLQDQAAVDNLLRATNGNVQCKHSNGEVSYVQLDSAGMGRRRIRVAYLPHDIPDEVLTSALIPYGRVWEVNHESWTGNYVYHVPSGVRYVTMTLTKHVPSTLFIANERVLLTYEGQPATCYVCSAIGHISSACPSRRTRTQAHRLTNPMTYADIVAPLSATGEGAVEVDDPDPRTILPLPRIVPRQLDTEPMLSVQMDSPLDMTESTFPPLPSLPPRREGDVLIDCTTRDICGSRSPVQRDEANIPLSNAVTPVHTSANTGGTLTDVTMRGGACRTSAGTLNQQTDDVSPEGTRGSTDGRERRYVHSKGNLEGKGEEMPPVTYGDGIDVSRDTRTDDTSTDSTNEGQRKPGGSSKRKKTRKARARGDTSPTRTRSRSRTIISGAVRDRMEV
jgi:hypothetical protein